MDTLRSELIETQKARLDLLKWKLLIVSGVGGAALGFSGSSGPANAHYALAILPFACAYVDLLCRHLSLRNKALGAFIEKSSHDKKELKDYEFFYAQLSKKHDEKSEFKTRGWNGFSFESLALVGLTIFISLAIIPIGISVGKCDWSPVTWPANLFYLSGLFGLLLSAYIEFHYRKYKSSADKIMDLIAGESTEGEA